MSSERDASPMLPETVSLTHFGVEQIDSLDWARDEITDALVRAHAALAHVPPGLAEAALCLRQSARALEVVGLEAHANLLAAAARLVTAMEAGDSELSEYSLTWVHQAIDAINTALEARAGGLTSRPLQWLPLYRQLCTSCGEAVRASDLFYPDLNRRPVPLQSAPVSLPDHLQAEQARFEHRRFERGMRAWLREPLMAAGVTDMRRAVHAIERSQRIPSSRAFWWAATALLDALLDAGLAITPELRQLIQALERQIRHLLAGAVRVPDGLMREVLYHVAIARSTHANVEAVRAAYQLQELLPPSVTEDEAPAPALPHALEQATAALARGRNGDPFAFAACRDALEVLMRDADSLPDPELGRLLAQCVDAAARLANETGERRIALAQELENALDALSRGFAAPGQNDAELQRQGELIAAHLAELEFDELRRPAAPSSEALVSMLEGMSAQASFSRAALLQAARSNFEQLENGLQQSLHAASPTEALQALSAPIRQLDEALVQLGAGDVRALLDSCAQSVRTLIDMGAEAEEAVFPDLVATLSQLGEAVAAMGGETGTETPAAPEASLPSPLPDIVLAGGLARKEVMLDDLAADALLRAAEPADASEAAPAARVVQHITLALPQEVEAGPLTLAEFIEQARLRMLDILAGLQAWRAAPHESERPRALIAPLTRMKQIAARAGVNEIRERAHSAAVMLDATPPSLAACEPAIGELRQALDRLIRSQPQPAPQPETQPEASEPMSPASPTVAPPGPISARLSRSIEEVAEMAIAGLQLESEIKRLREGLSELQQRAAVMTSQVQNMASWAAEAGDRAEETLAMLTEGAQDLALLQSSLTQRLTRMEAVLGSQLGRQREVHQALLDMANIPADALRVRMEASLGRAAQAAGVAHRLSFIGDELALPPALIDGLGGVFDDLLPRLLARRGQADRTPLEFDVELSLKAHALTLALGPVDEAVMLDLDDLRLQLGRLPVQGACEVTRVPRSGRGEALRLALPLPGATIPALIVTAGNTRAAVPAHMVIHRQILEGEMLAQVEAARQFVWQGESWPLRELPELFGHAVSARRRAQLLLMRNGDQRLALVCEPLLTERELVLTRTLPALNRLPGMIGATLLDDNQVLLVIDPPTLAECKPRPERDADEAALAIQPLRLLLVDDSPTARKHARNVLSEAGFDVVAVRSAGHALDCLRDVNFAAALIDSDMPGIDGLELVRRLRADKNVGPLPVIMLSSRHSAAHREAARQAGVDYYLTKPWQPTELISHLQAGLTLPGSSPVADVVADIKD